MPMSLNKPSLLSVLLVVACVALFALPAAAELGGVMFVSGARQGNFKGSPKGNGREGMRILEVRTQVASPSGRASGKRQHKPITVVKEVDAASPKLTQALQRREVLQVTIEFNPAGRTPEKMELTNAVIVNIHTVRQGAKEAEEIELEYQKIEWTFTGGKKTLSDDWHQ
jgi:type VI secretion system secreted protein Hcp